MKTLVCITPLLLFALSGCTSSKSMLAENTALFMQGQYEDAHKGMEKLLTKTGNEAYPLYQLTDASMLYAMGDIYHASQVISSAARNLEVDLSTGTVALDLMGSDENTHYRGNVHERVLARYYLGLAYFQMGYYDSASIAFQQALERDINKEDGKEASFGAIHFMLGETFFRMGDYENGVVAFRNSVRLKPKFAPGWYKLAVGLKRMNDNSEAERAYRTYRDSCECSTYLDLDESASYVFAILDMGWGPRLSPDALTGSFASYVPSGHAEKYASLEVGGQSQPTYMVEDVFVQAKDEANLAGDVTKKLASVATKTIMKSIPIVGLFAGSTAADVRKWLLLPGEIHVALIPAPSGVHPLTLRFYDKEKKELPEYQQSWYYVPARSGGNSPLVYFRSLKALQNQAAKKN